MEDQSQLQVGQSVTTKYGEVLTVLDVRQSPPVTKKGAVVKEGETQFLAQSGEAKCWFPLSYIAAKGAVNG